MPFFSENNKTHKYKQLQEEKQRERDPVLRTYRCLVRCRFSPCGPGLFPFLLPGGFCLSESLAEAFLDRQLRLHLGSRPRVVHRETIDLQQASITRHVEQRHHNMNSYSS